MKDDAQMSEDTLADEPDAVERTGTTVGDALGNDYVELRVQIQLEGEGFASRDEMDIRYELEDLLDEKVGYVTGAGTGIGVAEVWVAVASNGVDEAMPRIWSLLKELGLEDVATVEIQET